MVEVAEIRMEVVPDESPDASYLEQEGLGFEDRLAAYRAGEFGFVGVRAVAELHIPTVPYSRGGWFIQTVSSPGLWGIEDDSGEEYFKEVYEEEVDTLRDMLAELGVKLPS
jgi:hypothetical protein